MHEDVRQFDEALAISADGNLLHPLLSRDDQVS